MSSKSFQHLINKVEGEMILSTSFIKLPIINAYDASSYSSSRYEFIM